MYDHRKDVRNYLQRIRLYEMRKARWNEQLKDLLRFTGFLNPDRLQYFQEKFIGYIKELTEKQDRIIRKIVALPDKSADLLIMIFVQDLKIQDIADLLNRREDTTRLNIGKALDIFYKMYGGAYGNGTMDQRID